jgi:hypothetical protein
MKYRLSGGEVRRTLEHATEGNTLAHSKRPVGVKLLTSIMPFWGVPLCWCICVSVDPCAFVHHRY